MKKSIFNFCCFVLFITTLSRVAFAVTDNALDTRAKQLPYESGQSVNDIVKNLTADLTSEREKARVLAAFMVYQFQRNGYTERTIENAANRNKQAPLMPDNDILKTRIGTSQEFATLYTELCKAAKLNCVTIIGYAGINIQSPQKKSPAKVEVIRHGIEQLTGMDDYRMQKYEASWNAVQWNNKWHLIDTYWMIAGNIKIGLDIKTTSKMATLLKRREQNGVRLAELTRGKRIDDAYFDAKPRQFIKTHYPLDDKWQLLPYPVKWQTFLK